jgi:uncharacterized protein (DUF2062 family)
MVAHKANFSRDGAWHNGRAMASSRAAQVFYDLRTEGAGTGREAAAVGLGMFIGSLPVYGFHLLLCWSLGWLLKLNRLKMYLAAQISNPFFAPTLVFVEIQVGAWVLRGALHPLTIQTARTTDLAVFGVDALVGGLVVGGLLGLATAAGTYAMSRESPDDRDFQALVREASDRYITTSMTAWEFARGKLRNDPVYRAVVCEGLLPSGGTVVDVGCGQGLTLALLIDAARQYRTGRWPARWQAPPVFERAIGIERRRRTASIARSALASDAEIVDGDVRAVAHSSCRGVLYMDVLHMMPWAEQDAVIAASAAALEPGGVMLVREADASAGWRFRAVVLGNRLKALAFGAWRQQFYYRSAAEWTACFARHGLRAEVRPMSSGAFANVLLRLTRAHNG